MNGLVLKLRANEQFMVNGVVIQNGNRRARLTVKTPGANLLRLRDAIHPNEVDTPVQRICYIAQLAVAGEVEGDEALAQIEAAAPPLARAFGEAHSAAVISEALTAARAGNFYACLRAMRKLLPREALLLQLEARVEEVPDAEQHGNQSDNQRNIGSAADANTPPPCEDNAT